MNRKFVFLASLLLVLAISGFTIAQVLPDTPADYYGQAQLDSSDAANGSVFESYVDGTLNVNTTLAPPGLECNIADCSGYYLVHLAGSNGSNVTFKLLGLNASEAAQNWSLGSHEVNLTFTSLSNGNACHYAAACSSGICATDFDGDGRFCAASGSCTHNGVSYANGESVCGDSTTLQSCSSGFWTSSTCSGTCSNGACTSSSGSGGGGSSSGSSLAIESIIIDKVDASTPGVLTVKSNNIDALKITGVTVNVNTDITNLEITVTQLGGASGASELGVGNTVVYQYVDIKTSASSSRIIGGKVTFRVERSWILSNNIDESTIALYRFNSGSWNKLNTKEISRNENYINYEAESPGFSVFSVAGEKSPEPVSGETPSGQEPTGSGQQPSGQQPTEQPGEQESPKLPELPQGDYNLVIVVVIILILAGLAWYFMKGSGSGRSGSYKYNYKSKK